MISKYIGFDSDYIIIGLAAIVIILFILYIVNIVQPGLSKAAASIEQLKLLSLTEVFLWETRMIELGVIASA